MRNDKPNPSLEVQIEALKNLDSGLLNGNPPSSRLRARELKEHNFLEFGYKRLDLKDLLFADITFDVIMRNRDLQTEKILDLLLYYNKRAYSLQERTELEKLMHNASSNYSTIDNSDTCTCEECQPKPKYHGKPLKYTY